MRYNWFLSRTLCDVLEDMRRCSRTKNYSNLDACIEEAQSMANRMESALQDIKDVAEMKETWHDLRKQVKGLQKEKAGLVKNIDKLKERKISEPG